MSEHTCSDPDHCTSRTPCPSREEHYSTPEGRTIVDMTAHLAEQSENIVRLCTKIHQLRALCREVVAAFPGGIILCDTLHHPRKDQHGYHQPCPVEDRLRVLLAKLREQGGEG